MTTLVAWQADRDRSGSPQLRLTTLGAWQANRRGFGRDGRRRRVRGEDGWAVDAIIEDEGGLGRAALRAQPVRGELHMLRPTQMTEDVVGLTQVLAGCFVPPLLDQPVGVFGQIKVGAAGRGALRPVMEMRPERLVVRRQRTDFVGGERGQADDLFARHLEGHGGKGAAGMKHEGRRVGVQVENQRHFVPEVRQQPIDWIAIGFVGPLGVAVDGMGGEDDPFAAEMDVREEGAVAKVAEPVVIALWGAARDLLDDGHLREQLRGVVGLHVQMVGPGAVQVLAERVGGVPEAEFAPVIRATVGVRQPRGESIFELAGDSLGEERELVGGREEAQAVVAFLDHREVAKVL